MGVYFYADTEIITDFKYSVQIKKNTGSTEKAKPKLRKCYK